MPLLRQHAERRRPSGVPAAADAAPEVAQLLAAGRKIDAIRLVRQRTGAGLREAKDYVEAIEGGRTPSPLAVRPVLPAQPGAGRGGAIIFWLVLVAVGALLYWWMGSTR